MTQEKNQLLEENIEFSNTLQKYEVQTMNLNESREKELKELDLQHKQEANSLQRRIDELSNGVSSFDLEREKNKLIEHTLRIEIETKKFELNEAKNVLI